MAVVIAVIYRIRNRHKTAPAKVSKLNQSKKIIQGGITMEKETKVIKEKVKQKHQQQKLRE